ncbi:formin-binding protein 1-like isoform X1 [Diabrotica virgifera virgifera]|uniref:Formin-binding protein 1-like isoform X1 n=1 Tax=Diabrotica virgifera virgifera TaxID=50390 RepID=A0A6P7G1Y8_DIAVI|nr:formin-binding protein 1-like isoform X1 [Diabrotica virgifera virgifera]
MTAVAENLNWGTELWDQYDNLSLHTLKGIDFLEKYGQFVRDRASIECEYATKLRRLVKSYQPKKKDEDDYQFTSCKAFRALMNEVNDLAGQHELVAEDLQANVIKELTALVKDLKEERKKQLQEGLRLSQTLQAQIEALQRAKKAYDKAYRESEKAIESFQKADADFNLSRAEVEKQRSNMSHKTQVCDSAKNEYAQQLQRTNELQRQHFRSGLPEVFRQLQELDEKRIKNIKNFFRASVDIERNVFPIINKCLDGILKAADIINEKEDTMLVIEKFKSGFQPPEDFPFEDLSKGGSDSGSANNINNIPASGKVKEGSYTVKGTITNKAMKKRTGIFHIFGSRGNAAISDGKEDLSELPPNQRRKKLMLKVEELKNKVAQETATRDGLMKMKGVYEANPALGDPRTVESQLNECSHRLDKLQQDLARYQAFLEDTIKGIQSGHNNSLTNSPRLLNGSRRRNSGGSAAEEESLSRSASDSSVNHNNHNNHNHSKPSAPGTPQMNNHGCSNSPESGLGTSHTSLPGADSDPDQYDGNGGESEYYEADLLPSIGTCKALYPFEATSEGSIPMSQDEELHLIELDQGDGWTRVRRMLGDLEEGFVPTSYIEYTLFNT